MKHEVMFGDVVQIMKSGFYYGRQGRVTGFRVGSNLEKPIYVVLLVLAEGTVTVKKEVDCFGEDLRKLG